MNAIYKVIFNRATGQPVVVSEFGKGKQKSSTCKSIKNAMVFLVALNAMPSFSATCDIATYICNLDTTWTVAGNNNNYGATTISDGKTWLVNGVQNWEYSGVSYKNYTNLKNVVNDGYVVKTGGNIVTSLPSNSLSLKFSGLDKSIKVFDSITQAQKTIKVYSPNALTEVDPYAFSVSVNFLKQNASYYNNTQLIKVNDGIANIALSKGAVYNIGEIRNSYLAEVDGISNNASLNWISEQTFIASSIDWINTSPTGNFTSNVTRYNGKFVTFDGSSKNVNSLQEFKDYNDWLVSSIENGLLDSGDYIFWLKKAYDTTTTKYEYSPFPGNADASNIPNAEGAIVYAHGSGALATISQLGKIEVHNGATNTFKVIVGEDDATIINDGKIIATGRILDLTSGAKFTNNNLLSLGGGNTSAYSNGQYSKTPIMLMDKGTLFHNAGVYNINARHAFNGGNGIVYGITLKDNARATNDGLINSGYWYGDTGLADTLSGSVRSVVVSDGASFTNQNGIIQLGIGEDGVSSDYLGNESAAIEAVNNGTALNAGKIVLGSNADGVFGFLANGNNIKMSNVGTIDVNSDGNGGQYTPAQSSGIYSQNGASGNIDNAGIINLNGSNNVGVKAISGGGASSSGVINVNKASGQSSLPNYGVWVEGTGSQVEIAGTVYLNGDGAIGAHARSGGTINLTGNAAVKFTSGQNQIGYFVYGTGSQINNSSSSVQDVTSDDSTLMRLDGGATFTGSSTPGSLMRASGQDSRILVATGAGTSVSTGNLILDLTGQGAIGVLVEGGATGVIDAGTNLLLNNASAIAAIADGDGHDISGKFTSNETSTKLDSSANLSSTEDQVTGYIARNGATLENSGNINFSGKNTTGLQVLDGSTGTNSGSITVQDGGKGLVASSTNQRTAINNTGNLTLKGGSDANRTTGIQASGNAVTVNMTAGTISLEGQGAIGVEVTNGASVNLAGTALPVFADSTSGVSNQIAFLISGAGSTLNAQTATVMDANGKGSTLFRIEKGASQQGVLSYNVSGEDGRGIWATGSGTLVNAAAGSHLSIQGTGAQGVYAAGGASATLSQGVTADLTGSGAVVGVVDGNEYDLAGTVTKTNTGTILTNEADITSGLAGATAFISQNQGMLVNKGNIDLTTGTGNTGIKVISGQFDNQASDITVSGVAVDVEGANSTVLSTGGRIIATDGVAAIRLSQGASLDLVGSGMGVVEGQGTAHGVLLDTDAAGLIVNGARIDVNAVGASGNGIENRAEIAGIQLNNTTINVQDGKGVRTSATLAQQNSGTINVAGNGTGLAFMAADGGITGNNLDLSNSSGLTINLFGKGGNGILANTADGATVKTAVSVNVTGADGGSALVVNNHANRVEQTGVLRSASNSSAVVDAAKVGTFINTGAIIAATDTSLAMAFDDGVDTVMRNGVGGVIQGVIALNNGNNSLYFDDASTLTGTATLGNGNNRVTLTGTARADSVIAGSGDNIFTVKGRGAVFNLLDGGTGSNDTLVFDAAVHHLTSASTLQNFERVALKNNSLLTLEEALVLTDGGIGAGAVDIERGSELAVKPSVAGDFTFDPTLTGQGLVSVSLDSSQSDFAFTGNTGSDFAGTLKLGTSHFQLEGDNTSSLTQASLVTGNESVVTVGTGEQQLGSLSFDGGTVQFGAVMPGDVIADNHITTSASGTLDIGGKGTVQVTLGGGVINHVPASLSKKSLMEQDDATTLVQLAGAEGAVKGTGGQLNLVDENGNVISDVQHLDIVQDGNTVAKGTWDYQMVSSSDGITSDGLYIAYGLKEVELMGTGDNALTLAVGPDAQGLQTDLRVKVTGSGDLAIDTGSAQTVSLSNGGNDYTGATSVISGTLRLDADNTLGLTSAVNVAAGSVLDINGSYQTAGALNTEAGSQVMLDAGSHLTLTHAQREAGMNDAGSIAGNTLIGAGELEVLSGELYVDGANTGYTGEVALNGGANAMLNDVAGLGNSGTVTMTSANDTLTLNDGVSGALAKTLAGNGGVVLKDGADITLAADNSGFSGLFTVESGAKLTAQGPGQTGKADIENHGSLVLNNVAAWTVENHITGTGDLVKNGRGNVTLTQSAAHYTGNTDVNLGILTLGDVDNAVSLASSAVNVARGAVFGGYGSTAGDVINQGTFVLGEYGVVEATPLQFAVGGNLTNASSVLIGQSGARAGNTLQVSGDYVGNNGTIHFNTVLGDDRSATDRMVIGGSTSGNTTVSVTNAGGSGAATLNGIELITVGGKSEGEFTQSGRIVAGAYDYRLTRGQGSNSGNWYLVSRDTTPVDPVIPDPEPGTGPDTGSGTDTDTGTQPKPDWIRPEASLYGVNMAAANTLFTHRLHDRLGETHYVDALTGEKKVTSMWLRNVGGHTRSKDSSGQMNTQSNRYVMQMGGDIAQWSSDGENRYHLGVMAGYANQKSNARNHLNGNKADSSINGYSLGIYGTWLQDNEAKTGAWVDTWLLYNWFDNTVSGKSAGSESYKSKGFTASVEGGYTWKLGERDERTAYYIQPKAQAIWMGVKADDLTESNGTRVTGEGDGNIQTRLGARAFIKGHSTLDDGKERTFEPFIEANWIHNTETFGATLNGVRVNQAGTRNIGELKVGVDGQLSRNVNLWGNVAQQVGDDGYSDSSAMLGLKVSF
ncbi:autotransporter outer membrane beta-barrel domain-containing protein [Enterobacter bugandensis]|nr:autotransporter outer membrane beta-barrel domain-containing protein [Enterobacter bugandensis]EKS7119203.1 autotransporter outer membrane beta-barrel domain-containing protein [Enterobacter bugandensis]